MSLLGLLGATEREAKEFRSLNDLPVLQPKQQPAPEDPESQIQPYHNLQFWGLIVFRVVNGRQL